MKFLLVFILLVSIFSCENLQKEDNHQTITTNCDCSELLLDNNYNRFYLTNKKQPFTGHCIGYFPQTNIISVERDLVDGKYDGIVIENYRNGILKSSTDYKKHFMNGHVKIYNEKGILISHSIYKQSTLIEVIEVTK